MRYLIILLTSLFLVSNASADEDVKVITIDEINESLKKQPEGAWKACKYLDDYLVGIADTIMGWQENIRKENKKAEEGAAFRVEIFLKSIEKHKERIKETSEIYYNLSCVEVLRR